MLKIMNVHDVLVSEKQGFLYAEKYPKQYKELISQFEGEFENDFSKILKAFIENISTSKGKETYYTDQNSISFDTKEVCGKTQLSPKTVESLKRIFEENGFKLMVHSYRFFSAGQNISIYWPKNL